MDNINKIGIILDGEYKNWFVAYTGNSEDGYYIYLWSGNTIYDDYYEHYEIMKEDLAQYIIKWTNDEIPENMRDISE